MKRPLLLFAALMLFAAGMAQELRTSWSALTPRTAPKVQLESVQGPVASASAFKAAARTGEAAETMGFHYWNGASVAQQGWTALCIPNQPTGTEIWQMIEVPAATLAKFSGNQLTGMSVYTGCNVGNTANNIVNVTLVLTHDLESTPFYTQTVKLGTKKFSINNVKFTSPIDIDPSQPLYAGYYFTLTSTQKTSYFIPIDGVPTDQTEGCWVKYMGFEEDAQGKFIRNTEPVWDNFAAYYGSLMIDLNITGPNLPKNIATPVAIATTPVSYVGGELIFGLNFTNWGVNGIDNVDVEYIVNNGEAKTVNVSLAKPVAYSYEGQAVVKDVCPAAAAALPIRARVTKVNGVENSDSTTWAQGGAFCLNPGTGYTRNVLVEEGTGAWCKWCPLGYLALENAAARYTDGSMVLAALHNGDPYANNAAQTVINKYFDGFPMCVFNRTQLYGFQQSQTVNDNNFDKIYTELRKVPALAKVDLQLVQGATAGTIEAKTSTEFALSNSNGYKIGFTVIEDKLGPCAQVNALAGTPGFGIFSSGGATVNVMYNDVVRNIVDPFGIDNSLPVDVEAGVKYDFAKTLSLSSVKNSANARIAAFIINAKTGAIENVVEAKVADAAGAGVEDLLGSDVTVEVLPGAVYVSGADNTEVFSISGVRAGHIRGEGTLNLPAGLYIVKAGDRVQKIVVR